MSLIRWSPLREMEAFSRHFNELFRGGGEHEAMALFDWRPSVDVRETPEHFEIIAELPGVDKDHVQVTLDAGVLAITGERLQRKTTTHHKVHRAERSFGRFERSFTLPDTVDEGQVTADFDNGVLTLKLGKRAPSEKTGRRIEIG